ncbi:DUF4184 family protein [Dactylosporangium sp. NPDC051541]|uniref:DUF4184 family protein n=1 Tax=Dactylosporangium sp. NPDC051541 TaxID=3363977 RepID=UPI0037B92A49
MPSTLPTHPLAVLPLKLWKPRWFDGVALATGACAPDFAYALDGPGVLIPSHTIPALLWWSLPTAVAVASLARWGAPAVAAHLPWFLREYGVLGRVRHRWYITASSALLGAASHLLWDLVTHPGPVAAWWPIRQACDVSALFLFPLYILYVGLTHKIREWHGEAPAFRTRPVRFWGVMAAVLIAGCALTGALGDRGYYLEHVHVFLVRLMVAGALAFVAGALAVQSQGADDRAPRAAALSRR